MRATYAAFIGLGFAFATWASRIPQVKKTLHLSPAALGLVLLAIAAGSLIALPLAGVIVHRFGARPTVTSSAPVLGIALAVIAFGYSHGVVFVLLGLFLFGGVSGAWDVAMNVQGADVERQLGRSIMSRFHAGFSVGTVAGALLGAIMVALHVSVTVHLLVVAILVAFLVPIEVRHFLPDSPGADVHGAANVQRVSPLVRWRESRTILIGVCVLAFAFAEGAGNDWIGVSLIDTHHASAVVGTLCFTTFLAAMTSLRWFGTNLLDRFGRVRVIRILAAVAVAGVVLFAFSPNAPVAFVGALLWGCGASLGFPVGMSAAADDQAAAPGRVSVVASIGYVAFLGGPPLIGFLGDHLTVPHALTVVAILLGLAVLLAGNFRPLPRRP